MSSSVHFVDYHLLPIQDNYPCEKMTGLSDIVAWVTLSSGYITYTHVPGAIGVFFRHNHSNTVATCHISLMVTSMGHYYTSAALSIRAVNLIPGPCVLHPCVVN